MESKLKKYLTKKDGAVTRGGKTITSIAERTGYSIESLRSFAYGRRSPRDGSPKARKLKAILSRVRV